MQTFLPYADFQRSVRVLDDKRLGKQRVEALQIVRALSRPGYGWANHPAVLMWRGYEEALGRYGLTACEHWVERGFADTCAATIRADLCQIDINEVRSEAELGQASAMPSWLGSVDLHASHQAALVRKDARYYRQHFPETSDDLPYFWPVRSKAVVAEEERKGRSAVDRARRAVERAAIETERQRRRRSRAAKRGWVTRRSSGGAPRA